MDNPLRGIALLVGATMFFSVSDAIAKFLGQSLPVVEISWIRYLTFVVMAGGLVLRRGRRRLAVRSPWLQVARGVGLVGSALFFIEALKSMPLADAASVGFVSPLLITALSVPVLGEVVGMRRWLAILVGLLGVLVIVRPGTGAFQPAALFVLASSMSWALASVLTRKMAGTDDAATTLLYSAVTGFVLLCMALPFDFVWPTGREVALCLVLGVVASTGQYLMVLAYRHAGAALMAPFSYVQLIWSVSLGWLVFAALPDQWTMLGACIIVASGLYTVHRERIRARERRAVA
ncbi:MAG: DMT family transporter [Rhodospirillales bacterium]|nr:DMT family transporter [Rhodospirillales bacterium]